MIVTHLWLVRSPSHPHSPHMRWVPMKGAFCVYFNLGNLTRAPGHPGWGLGAFGGRTRTVIRMRIARGLGGGLAAGPGGMPPKKYWMGGRAREVAET